MKLTKFEKKELLEFEKKKLFFFLLFNYTT